MHRLVFFKSPKATEGEGMVSHCPWSSHASIPTGLSSWPGAGVQGHSQTRD